MHSCMCNSFLLVHSELKSVSSYRFVSTYCDTVNFHELLNFPSFSVELEYPIFRICVFSMRSGLFFLDISYWCSGNFRMFGHNEIVNNSEHLLALCLLQRFSSLFRYTTKSSKVSASCMKNKNTNDNKTQTKTIKSLSCYHLIRIIVKNFESIKLL